MQELLPIIAGIATALVLRHRIDLVFRSVALAVCSLAFGVIASYVSGELFVSWIYVAIDTTQVLLSAGVALVLLDRRRTMRIRKGQG